MLVPLLLTWLGSSPALAADPTVRVVVLDTGEIDHDSSELRRGIKGMIPDEEPAFVPGVDLYQGGRIAPDIAASLQTGSVPDSVISKLTYNADDIASVGFENMTPRDWEAYAEDLVRVMDQAWFVDRPELRAPMMNLTYQIGRAADNSGALGEPWVRDIDGMSLNPFYFRAAAITDGDDDLLDEAANDEQRDTLEAYRSYLETGRVNRAEVPLDLDDEWDADSFFQTYTIVVDGREIDPDGLPGKQRASLRRDGVLQIAPGTRDVFLKRADGGYGLSARVVTYEPDESVEPIREQARSEVAAKLVAALGGDADTCLVSPPDEVLSHLAVYGKLHDEPVYIALAKDDNAAKPLLFKWDPAQSSLAVIDSGAEPFPVRFAGILGLGVTFNGATYDAPAFEETDFAEPDLSLSAGYVPMFAELRGHYQHLVVSLGGEVQLPVEGVFADRYQTAEGQTVVDGAGAEVLKQPDFGRQVFIGGGYMHGIRAKDGFGIHAIGRVGYHDVPHVIELSAHGGLTTEGPIPAQGRIASLIQLDGFLGVMVPFGDTIVDKPLFNLGFTAGVGTTF